MQWGAGNAAPVQAAKVLETDDLRFRSPNLSDAATRPAHTSSSGGLAWGETAPEPPVAPAEPAYADHQPTATVAVAPAVLADEEPVQFADRLVEIASKTSQAEAQITLLAGSRPRANGSNADRLTELLQYREEETNPFEKLEEAAEPLPPSDPDEAAAAIDEEIQRRAREPREEIDEPSEEPTDRFEEPADDFLNELLTNEPGSPFEGFGEPDSGEEEFRIEGGMPLPEAMQFGDDEERRRQFIEREREEAERNCEEEYEKIVSDRIDSISLDIRVEGDPGVDYPFECGLGSPVYEPRQWPQITYTWKAANLCHKPLYFEQVALERYGHSFGFYAQPLLSGVHFFGTLPILPYKMGLKTPNECVYTLGHYRPGSCAPRLYGGFPFTWRAALFQTGVVTGTVFTIP